MVAAAPAPAPPAAGAADAIVYGKRVCWGRVIVWCLGEVDKIAARAAVHWAVHTAQRKPCEVGAKLQVGVLSRNASRELNQNRSLRSQCGRTHASHFTPIAQSWLTVQ